MLTSKRFIRFKIDDENCTMLTFKRSMSYGLSLLRSIRSWPGLLMTWIAETSDSHVQVLGLWMCPYPLVEVYMISCSKHIK